MESGIKTKVGRHLKKSCGGRKKKMRQCESEKERNDDYEYDEREKKPGDSLKKFLLSIIVR